MKKCARQVASADKPNSLGLSDDTDELRQIVELRPDAVADLPELLASVTVRIYRTADTFVVVARRFLNHFL